MNLLSYLKKREAALSTAVGSNPQRLQEEIIFGKHHQVVKNQPHFRMGKHILKGLFLMCLISMSQ
jgi:hypothetical protein